MIDRKSLIRHLSSPQARGDEKSAKSAFASHMRAMGCEDVPVKFTHGDPTGTDLDGIGMVEIRGWADYYSRSPDFIGLAKVGRKSAPDDLVESAAIEPRSVLGLITMLTEAEISTHDRYASGLLALNAAGCRRFWVGRTGAVLAMEETA